MILRHRPLRLRRCLWAQRRLKRATAADRGGVLGASKPLSNLGADADSMYQTANRGSPMRFGPQRWRFFSDVGNRFHALGASSR